MIKRWAENRLNELMMVRRDKKPFTGIVIHSGKDVLPFGEGFYSVPFAALA